jgi:hypothetical protein
MNWTKEQIKQIEQAFNFERSIKQNRKNPDTRLVNFSNLVNITITDTILELGSFEGHHTIDLYHPIFPSKLITLDVRITNCMKTLIHCFLAKRLIPNIICEDLEDYKSLPDVDYIINIGVLYHLTNPLKHLELCGEACSKGMLLDTHYTNSKAAEKHNEPGFQYPRAGVKEYSKWLPLPVIKNKVIELGFKIKESHERIEANGPRVCMYLIKDLHNE